MKRSFRVYFNKRKQWFDVYIASSPRKFLYQTGSYAYYEPERGRKSRRGKFGEIHLGRAGGGTAAHELLHLWIDWLRCRNVNISDKNEEQIVLLFDEMTRKFWINYYKWKKEL